MQSHLIRWTNGNPEGSGVSKITTQAEQNEARYDICVK